MSSRLFGVCLGLLLLAPAPAVSAGARPSAQVKARELASPWLPAPGYPRGIRNSARITLFLSHAALQAEPPVEEMRAELAEMDAPAKGKKLVASWKLASWTKDKKTAVILDLEGPWSAALAMELAEQAGYQPIPLLTGLPRMKNDEETGGSVLDEEDGSVRTMAALMVLGNRSREKAGEQAPPVFILDRLRLQKGALKKGKIILPKAEFLVKHGVSRLLYVHDARGRNPVASDLRKQLHTIGKARVDSDKDGSLDSRVKVKKVRLRR